MTSTTVASRVAPYLAGESWLYRIDPRVKLWFALLVILLCVFMPKLGLLATLLVVSHVVLILGRIPLREIARLWRLLSPIVLIILFWQPLLMPGDGVVLWQLGPVRLTTMGLLTGARYALRIAATAFAALVPILTTPINILTLGLQKVGMPYPWATAIGLALRYLGAIGNLYATISEAQQARGWDLSRSGVMKRARAAIPTLVALIIASLRLSDALALGLASRGFGSSRPRSYRYSPELSIIDWVAFVLITALFLITLVLALWPISEFTSTFVTLVR